MKNLVYSFLLLYLLVNACSPKKSQNDLLTIDVSKKYPKKTIHIKEIADIEYIPLGFHPEFLVTTRALVFNEKYIILRGRSGMIYIFDRQGNPIYMFSHYGNGPHEYTYITNLLFDKKREEIYIHDVFIQKIFVYSFTGEFITEYSSGDVRYIYNLNDSSFLFYNLDANKTVSTLRPYYSVVSKNDGKLLKEIHLPFEKIHKLEIVQKADEGEISNIFSGMHLPAIKYNDGSYFLNELSSDTIYKLSSTGELLPFMIREPKINSMNDPIYLQYGVETSKYIFMTTVSIDKENNSFPPTNLVYDKADRSIYEYNIINDDYLDLNIELDAHMINSDIIDGYGLIRLRVGQLIDSYENGKLHGELKDIAANLNEEDNDVIMVLKFK